MLQMKLQITLDTEHIFICATWYRALCQMNWKVAVLDEVYSHHLNPYSSGRNWLDQQETRRFEYLKEVELIFWTYRIWKH